MASGNEHVTCVINPIFFCFLPQIYLSNKKSKKNKKQNGIIGAQKMMSNLMIFFERTEVCDARYAMSVYTVCVLEPYF